MENNDNSFILACQNGDMEQFGQLYDKYIRKIYDFIYFKTHHKETAEDLTSRTFMKAVEKLSTFDTDKGTFQAWIYQIARNTVIDHYRTKKIDSNIEDIWDLSSHEDLVRDFDTREKLKSVEKYLSTLSAEQRDIVIMRVWQGMSHSEIAEALGKTEASVKMSYSRTIRTLREKMPLAVYLTFILNL